jgi:hypothetical protein
MLILTLVSNHLPARYPDAESTSLPNGYVPVTKEPYTDFSYDGAGIDQPVFCYLAWLTSAEHFLDYSYALCLMPLLAIDICQFSFPFVAWDH